MMMMRSQVEVEAVAVAFAVAAVAAVAAAVVGRAATAQVDSGLLHLSSLVAIISQKVVVE